jgi:outer membrane protein OmpA-like peptidoglycan-associated protein
MGLGLSTLMFACSHEKRGAADPSTTQQRPTLAANVEPEATPTETRPAPPVDRNQGALIISESITRQCDLPDTAAEAPQFEFDNADLRPRGMGILRDVADCMQNGSLKGRNMTITGHADPRGTADYNTALGLRRANATRDYLLSQGIPADRITVRSRGETDAVGTDPESWQLDRRVEVSETAPPNE